MKKLNLLGKTFGRLKVLREHGRIKNGCGHLFTWECECECGNIVVAAGSHLKRGTTKSCGCLCIEKTKKANTTHGLSKHPLYWKWSHMVRRGTGKDSQRFYGDRGIYICKEWLRFEPFYRWAIGKWEVGKDIDRIDTTKGYEPKNCRFVSRKRNTQNTRRSKLWVVYGKQFKSSGDAARFYGCCQSHIYSLCHGRATKTKIYYPEPFCYAIKRYPDA